MTLPRDYRGQTCALARSMEIVGERWTLLILRDAFYGVRRFGEFAAHLGVPRAVLTDRLTTLTEARVLERRPETGTGRREVYALTPKGVALWPHGPRAHRVGRGVPRGGRRPAPRLPARRGRGPARRGRSLYGLRHGRSRRGRPGRPRPGARPSTPDDDPVTAALARPHRLLQPLLTIAPSGRSTRGPLR